LQESILIELRNAEGTSFQAHLAAYTFFWFYGYDAIGAFEDSLSGTSLYAGSFGAVPARNRKEMPLDIREDTLGYFLDPSQFNRSRFDPLPLLTSYFARLAFYAFFSIEIKSILCIQGYASLILHIFTRVCFGI
jgi:hypothetical protein